jgi:type II secretory pathway component PulF
MTTTALDPKNPFAYQAQTFEGNAITGTIDAQSAEQAQKVLTGLQLRVLHIEPVQGAAPIARPLKAEDFISFNQQLAHLTKAGMPVEQGLRLIAQDMRRGRLAATIKDLAAELEKGTPLEQAFEKHQGRFPPLYSRLIGAGVISGNLPGLLMNLGRHMELVQRLRAALWRAIAYPLMVLVGLVFVTLFVSLAVIPQFESIFNDFGTRVPALTHFMLQLPKIVPWVFGIAAAFVVLILLLLPILRRTDAGRALIERIVLVTPLVGSIVGYNLLARWCDAAAIGVDAGLDLPKAIDLADDAVASPMLRHDGDELRAAILAGKSLDTVQHTRLLPATVVAAMALASQNHDLPVSLKGLSEMYQQQSQLRLSLLPGVLTPLLVLLLALVIGLIVLGLFMPIISLIQAISGP